MAGPDDETSCQHVIIWTCVIHVVEGQVDDGRGNTFSKVKLQSHPILLHEDLFRLERNTDSRIRISNRLGQFFLFLYFKVYGAFRTRLSNPYEAYVQVLIQQADPTELDSFCEQSILF